MAVVVAGLLTQTPGAVTEVRLWEAAGVLAGAALAGSARAAAEMTGIITVAQARRSDVFRLVPA